MQRRCLSSRLKLWSINYHGAGTARPIVSDKSVARIFAGRGAQHFAPKIVGRATLIAAGGGAPPNPKRFSRFLGSKNGSNCVRFLNKKTGFRSKGMDDYFGDRKSIRIASVNHVCRRNSNETKEKCQNPWAKENNAACAKKVTVALVTSFSIGWFHGWMQPFLSILTKFHRFSPILPNWWFSTWSMIFCQKTRLLLCAEQSF